MEETFLHGKILLPEGRLYTLNPAYAEAVAGAGGEPAVVRFDAPKPGAQFYDALLLCGGVDIDPTYFGETPLENAGVEIDAERDAFELGLFRDFLALGKPVYGICRGIQLINVALGGSLWQDMPAQLGLTHSAPKGETMWHDVLMADGTALSVNSYHHQCIRELGGGLEPLGRTEDGTVEAVRHTSLPIAAVQWHPERMGAEAFSILEKLLLT